LIIKKDCENILILKVLYSLRFFKKQKLFFFLNSIIDFNKQLTTIFKIKRKEYNKSIIIKVCIDRVTTKLQ